MAETCLLTRIVNALREKDYETASDLLVEMQTKTEQLIRMYLMYKKNLF